MSKKVIKRRILHWPWLHGRRALSVSGTSSYSVAGDVTTPAPLPPPPPPPPRAGGRW
ncbi:hypothetical protein JYU34_013951 [Plutella xylostella]|uniref:Uncharacterized protein n=1 Tax=Plutella xylostella TaxID=51655 RepID=A0ABQ7QB10_PLUXY|nr:hypothetical protein JYU34_013951 [Plutella xylostella]